MEIIKITKEEFVQKALNCKEIELAKSVYGGFAYFDVSYNSYNNDDELIISSEEITFVWEGSTPEDEFDQVVQDFSCPINIRNNKKVNSILFDKDWTPKDNQDYLEHLYDAIFNNNCEKLGQIIKEFAMDAAYEYQAEINEREQSEEEGVDTEAQEDYDSFYPDDKE